MEIYTLQNQAADAMLPVLNGVLMAGESVNAYNNSLIVSASATSQKKVADLLAKLDTSPRNLLISVRNNRADESKDGRVAVSGGIKQGELVLGAPAPIVSPNGMVMRQGGLRVTANNEQRQTNTQQIQQVRAIEGSPVSVSSGQRAAYTLPDRYGNRATHYVNAEQGVYVTARIVGNRVLLDISSNHDKFSATHAGVIDTENLRASVSGAVGEWINLGGITTQESNSGSRYTEKSSAASSRLADISVRVVPVE